jgi:hypothetical protein
MPRTRTTFQSGHAGMGGRPKGSKNRLPRGSLKAAWLAVTRAEPHLLEDAIRAGLTATRPSDRLGFLELGAKLMHEVGITSAPEPEPARTGGIRIILRSSEAPPLDAHTNGHPKSLPPGRVLTVSPDGREYDSPR